MKKLVTMLCVSALVASLFATGQTESAKTQSSTAAVKYPQKQVSLVVAGAAGSNMDIMARVVAPYLAEEMKCNVIVENIAGGGGVTGATAYLAEGPNTDKILLQPVSNILVTPLFTKVSYTPEDYVGIIGMADAAQGVFASPAKSGIASFEDLKNFPPSETLKYGSGGPSVWNGLLQADLYKQMGLKSNTVPHKSAGEGITNIMGGHTQVTLASMSQGHDYVVDGSIVPLFTFSSEPYVYDNGVTVPTIKSLGYDVNIPSYTYWAIRKGTDAAIVDYIYDAFSRVYQNAGFLEDMKKLNLEPYNVSGKEIDAFINGDGVPEVKAMYDRVKGN